MMADLDILIARGIRRVRLERGLAMRDIAGLLGVNVSTISRIESGQRRRARQMHDAHMVAEQLGVGVGYLLRDCPQCRYQPPDGYRCLRCGTPSEGL